MRRSGRRPIAAVVAAALLVVGPIGSGATAHAALAPVIAVSPHAGLRDHQGVTVSGIRYAPGSAITVRQCAPSTGRCRLRHAAATADAQGTFAIRDFEVRRLISRPDGAPIDCAVTECRIRVTSTGATASSLTRILSFDPAAPFDPAPTVTATPDTALPATQVVLATSHDFTPNERLTFRVCRVGTAGDVCDVGVDDFASSTGTQSTFLQVARRITDAAGHEHDCADPIGTCVLEVVGHGSGDVAAAAITFDATTPLPLVTVDAGDELPFRGTMAAHGRGLPPTTSFTGSMCAVGDAQPRACAGEVSGTSDATGRLDLSVPFRRRVHTSTVDEDGLHEFRYDCATAGVTCAVVLRGAGTAATDRVTFDPSAPIPPPPTITVTPAHDLPALATVSVTGSGFLPDRVVQVSQCDAVRSSLGTEVCADASTTSDASGHIATTTTVRRLFDPADCASAVGRCVVRATTDPDQLGETPEATEVVRAPLGFDPNAPPIEYTATATPSTGLTDRQPVAVDGSGFLPGAHLEIFPCTAAATDDFRWCDRDAGKFFDADATGAFHQTYAVHQILQLVDGSAVDCNVAPDPCVLWVGAPGVASIATKVPVTFAAHGPTPVVTARSRSITEPTGTNHSTKIELDLSQPTDHVVRVHWKTDSSAGTANPTTDYVGVYNGVVDILPGRTTATVRVDVVGDRIDEPDEWLPIVLFDPAGATVGGPVARLTIRDDDPPPSLRLGDATVAEGDTVRYALVPVALSEPSAFPITVHFATHQFTARSGTDFVDATGTLTIPPGSSSATIAVVVLGDHVHEATEGLLVTIDQPAHATVADGQAVLTITDDD